NILSAVLSPDRPFTTILSSRALARTAIECRPRNTRPQHALPTAGNKPIWRASMRTFLVSAALMAALLGSGAAQAKGCIKGAVVGGVAGHYAGHHGLIGAAAGCAIGHHEAKKHAREKAQQ